MMACSGEIAELQYIVTLEAQVARLEARVAELEATVQELLERLQQDACTSSRPPSSAPPERQRPRRQKPKGRSIGCFTAGIGCVTGR